MWATPSRIMRSIAPVKRSIVMFPVNSMKKFSLRSEFTGSPSWIMKSIQYSHSIQLNQKMIQGFFHRRGQAKDLDDIQKAKQEAVKELNLTQQLSEKPNQTLNSSSETISTTPPPPAQEQAYKQEENFFVEKMRLMEEKERIESEKSYGFFKLPLLLLSATLYIFYQWENAPFSEVFKHATISEYIPREKYYHSIFTGALSMMNQGSLIVYGPAMIYSLFLCSSVMKQRHIALLFASNALLTCAITFYYERSKVQPGGTTMVTPKAHGAVTPLAFMSAFLGISPNYCLKKIRLLPFFIIPAFYFMFECYEFSNVYVNEVSRPAHISAMVYGLLFGIIFKRYVL